METVLKETSSQGKSSKLKKWLSGSLIILVLVLGGFVYFHYFFVFGTGVKSGQLNYVVHKGYIFKTYEGKLIQAGFNNSNSRDANSTIVQSNQFEFSISKKAVADSLMLLGGREVDLGYIEYKNAVPWRGNSKYVVDRIVAVK